MHNKSPQQQLRPSNIALEKNQIPASAELKRKLQARKKELEVGLTQLKAQHAESSGTEENKKDKLEKEIKKLEIDPSTMNEINALTEELENNSTGHGPYWWTIAVPSALHKNSDTYGGSAKKQSNEKDAFLSSVRHYLKTLEQKAGEFGLTNADDYFEALFAFRYMYRCQTKVHQPIGGQAIIGPGSRLFFRSNEISIVCSLRGCRAG